MKTFSRILTKNAIRCNKCETTIESTFQHDFKWCKCEKGQRVAVDGGLAYAKRVWEGDESQWDDVSEYKPCTPDETC